MTGNELKRDIRNNSSSVRCFIKWWRKENDFADYELVDHFLENLSPKSEIEGYQLLTMGEMLQELKRHEPTRVWVDTQHGEKVLHWQHAGSDGVLREDTYRYMPEVLMALFDKVTHGDTLC